MQTEKNPDPAAIGCLFIAFSGVFLMSLAAFVLSLIAIF